MKKKRVSKRNKIAWRKHVNIDDVEDFLEDLRLEERLGLKLSTATDQELFIVDKTPSTESVFLSKKEKSRLKLANPKCFEILKPHTNVPDPVIKRNRVRTRDERRNKLVVMKEEERKAKGILKAKEIDSIKGKEIYEKKKLTRPKRGEFLNDIWDVQDVKKADEWIEEKTIDHNLWKTGVYMKKVIPTVQKKTSVLPTVEVPHPGLSYNPSFEDHQDLLKQVADKERELIKRDQHLNRVTRHIRRTVPEDKNRNSWLEEMSQGLPSQTRDIKEEETGGSDNEYKSINPPAKNKKKTLKQRRKYKEHLHAERMRKIAKIEKKKVSDLHRLRALKDQVNIVEKKEILNKQRKEKLSTILEKKTKRLGAKKFEEMDLEFNMPNELSGNLRAVQKKSNLLVDRFVSLQKRNVIPPTSSVKAKKPKIKRYVKPGHKDDWKSTIAGLKA